jgi:hypothetical protein
MTGLVPFSSNSLRNLALSYALSPSTRLGFFTLRISRSAAGQSCAWPPVNRNAIRRPLASASAWIFVLRPPRERPTACFCFPLFLRQPNDAEACRERTIHGYADDRFHAHKSRKNLFWLSDEQWERIEPHLPTDVRGVERVDDRRVHAVVDGRRRTVLGRAIAPAATGFQDMAWSGFPKTNQSHMKSGLPDSIACAICIGQFQTA